MKLPSVLTSEPGLYAGIAASVFFYSLCSRYLTTGSSAAVSAGLFFLLFVVMLWSSFGVVRHADGLAVQLGEPYGTLILTLSVISIEVIMISAVMLTGSHNPTLGRDVMFSVLMIVLNGLVGLSLLLGGIRHVEQTFNLQGANSFLGILIPLSVLGLILPNFTESTRAGTFSLEQIVFLVVMNVVLYLAFLGMQTMRHRSYFVCEHDDADHGTEKVFSVPAHVLLLVFYMIPIVLLSKKLAVIVDYGISELGAPADLGGLIVAILVLSPEGMAAIKAARVNNLQRSINICLGSALATIGMTIPAVLLIGILISKTIVLGLNNVEALLLVLTLLVSMVNFSSGKSNLFQGVTHLTLFFCFIILIFD
ncbi:calcium:proton antiporter [Endozoicomonas arenosclerae]|uniref:calcium:proton antiporter n=1 Tax=Endozoicomonas arenosclerae TaxID=1633495 RepID=UPI000780669B|nr:calcium:proton antiporter [Endozoicomonas arenosclerae]